MDITEFEDLTQKVADLILSSQKIIFFSGAGISTESGIPDFRSPGGIWERFDPDDFTYHKFISNPEARRKQWRMMRDGLLTDAIPNPAHYGIAELDKLGKVDCIITQNIDNLHATAGVPEEKIYELHGNMKRTVCLDCGHRYSLAEIRARLENGEEIPDCKICHGTLKPDIVMFGEQLPAQVLQKAESRASDADLFIVVGSTLIVYPAAYMPEYALNAGAKLVIINLTSTPLDRYAEVIIRAKAGETISSIVQKVKDSSNR
jgi:NAD-dependent deacetylase